MYLQNIYHNQTLYFAKFWPRKLGAMKDTTNFRQVVAKPLQKKCGFAGKKTFAGVNIPIKWVSS